MGSMGRWVGGSVGWGGVGWGSKLVLSMAADIFANFWQLEGSKLVGKFQRCRNIKKSPSIRIKTILDGTAPGGE
jgi:hypothetical protein